jgi:biotin carboxyl carrier protein
MTTITALPTAPSRADPANFRTRADAFMAALPTFASETNTVAGEVNTNATNAATSASTATTQAGTATTQAGNASASAAAAAASALTALNAPGTSATSTTSLSIGTGAKSLTIQTGKSIVVGMTLVIARTSAPTTTRMSGVVSSYDSGTGALGVTVDSVTGSGTHTDWTVSLSAAVIGSDLGKRVIQVKVIDDLTTLTTGDGKVIFLVPQELNGYNLVGANAFVTTVSSSGTPTIQIRNVTDSVDMLSTRITIDASEYTSYTAAAAAVVNATYDDVATGDRLAVDVDVAGTGAKGLGIVLTFQLP